MTHVYDWIKSEQRQRQNRLNARRNSQKKCSRLTRFFLCGFTDKVSPDVTESTDSTTTTTDSD